MQFVYSFIVNSLNFIPPPHAYIHSLSATHSSQVSLLAVTIEKKEDEKAVCLIDWKKHKDYKIIAS